MFGQCFSPAVLPAPRTAGSVKLKLGFRGLVYRQVILQ